jgi:YjbE family integral membrane protein
VWIGVKLLVPEDDDDRLNMDGGERLWSAVKTVIVADLVMSIDNVIAIAGAAENVGGEHKMVLVIFGLLVSIPIIVAGSQLVIRLMDRFPFVITWGGMLLGWIAGFMAVSDPAIASHVPDSDVLRYACGTAGALLVFALGKLLARRAKSTTA